jgi:hypothetical protein
MRTGKIVEPSSHAPGRGKSRAAADRGAPAHNGGDTIFFASKSTPGSSSRGCRQDGAGSFLQIRQHADDKSPAVVRAELSGWSKNIFISKTQFASVVPLFSFPTQGSRQRQLLLPLS